MDWSNEEYVRVYTRDTTTWKLLEWDGQCVLMQVLRRLDRSGVLELAGLQPWEAVVIHCGAPSDVAMSGMGKCLARGVLIRNGDYLVAPKFREAQTASKSDKQRQKESREKRRTSALEPTPPPDSDVTKRDDSESHGVTSESQDVTKCHAESHAVTNGHALSLSALRHVALQPSATRCSAAAAGPEVDRPIEPGSTAAVLREWHLATATTGTPRGLFELVQACEAQARAEKTTPEAIAKRTITAFRADPYVQRERAGFGLLVKQLDRWVGPPSVSTLRFKGPSKVASAEEYAADAAMSEEEAPWNVSQK